MAISRGRGIKLFANRLKASFWIGAIFFVGIGVASAVIAYRVSQAEQLANGVRVSENSELDYYLDVKYDGIDRNGVHSDDSTRVEVRSGVMTVTDRIPDGLIFQGFVETSNGIIAAHTVNDNAGCAGLVVDDTGETTGWNADETEYVWHGLHYVKATETVTFRVKKLMAGCIVTVGIRTKTPRLREGEKRRDFYNYGTVVEDYASVDSNLTHHWIGKDDDSTRYTVRYSFTGTAPEGAKLPAEQQYIGGSTVNVATNPVVRGYDFSGWTTTDAEIQDGKFVMPESDVTLVGAFAEKQKYKVTYVIDGEAPEDYAPPVERNYGAGEYVELDSTSEGWSFRGYRFSGWTSSDLTIDDGSFEMPSADVAIHGAFTKIGYKVKYEFTGDVLPNNASSLLPAQQTQYPGDKVSLAAAPTANGYSFLGWMAEDGFEMPENDVTVYGKWMSLGDGVFRPEIKQVITNPQDKYYVDDEVDFKITIKNTASYRVQDVNVLIDLKGTTLSEPTDSDITLRSSHIALISEMEPGETKTLRASYDVHEDYVTTIESPAELLSASSDSHTMDISDAAKKTYRVVSKFNTGIESDKPEPSPNPDTPEDDPDPTPEPPVVPDDPSTPNTLDEILKYVTIFAGCSCGLGLAVIIVKAHRK
ncbi:InlB B-repeat-containing protein [Candidatus Saccharibacteria bacterium]|nr:InlB B-repeat-containing protein [Candidatus Saccharibacteria bacterium]